MIYIFLLNRIEWYENLLLLLYVIKCLLRAGQLVVNSMAKIHNMMIYLPFTLLSHNLFINFVSPFLIFSGWISLGFIDWVGRNSGR